MTDKDYPSPALSGAGACVYRMRDGSGGASGAHPLRRYKAQGKKRDALRTQPRRAAQALRHEMVAAAGRGGMEEDAR